VSTVPTQVRLPVWARDFIDSRANQRNASKTDVIVEAIECLKQREIEALMREGYKARAAQATEISEAQRGALQDLPEW